MEEEYDKYGAEQDTRHDGDPDVLLDVPILKVEEIDLEVEDLRAHVSLRAEVGDLVKINVGVDAYLNHLKLEVKGVEAQALLKVRLERVLDTLNRAIEAIDRNPQLLGVQTEAASQLPEESGESSDIAKHTVSDESADKPVTTDRPVATTPGEEGYEATDAARKRAGELGMNLYAVKGTGAGGRILVRDVIEAAGRG